MLHSYHQNHFNCNNFFLLRYFLQNVLQTKEFVAETGSNYQRFVSEALKIKTADGQCLGTRDRTGSCSCKNNAD